MGAARTPWTLRAETNKIERADGGLEDVAEGATGTERAEAALIVRT